MRIPAAALLLACSSLAVPASAIAHAADHARKARPAESVGEASWYGPGFQGRTTASGEIFDQRALTAAHPTLELSGLVEVTNLENGRSVVLRVNNRGPFVDGRIIDVSRRAAGELGFLEDGTARVEVDVLAEGLAGKG